MNKENDDLIDIFGGRLRKGKRIEESPLAQGVEELIGEVNREALEGKGEYRAELGEQPTDTIFSLAWEGAITKKQEVSVPDQPFTFLVLPKRRGCPLRSAPKPCVRLVASHGSSRVRSVVSDTPCRVWHAFGRDNVGEGQTCC